MKAFIGSLIVKILLLGCIPYTVLGGCSKDREDVIQAFETTSWTNPHRGILYLKCETDRTGDLLLMYVGSESSFAMDKNPRIPAASLAKGRPIYRYDNATNKLLHVPPEVWDAAKGDLLMCGMQLRLQDVGTFVHDSLTSVVKFSGRTVATAGRTVLKALPDPTGEYVAVLSTQGELRKPVVPFGDPVVKGERFHQLFRRQDASEIGKPVKLDVDTDRDYIDPCWSPDGRFIVYHNASEHLWIIDMSRYTTGKDN